MGPHSRQQSTQQSTNIICNRSTLLKLEEKILLIWLLLHVNSDVQRWQSSDGKMGTVRPTGKNSQFQRMSTGPNNVSNKGWQGAEGGRGLQTSYLSATKGAHRVTFFFWRHDAGKNAIESIDHGSCRRHTSAMGPHSRQESTQQSTNIICNGYTSLNLEEKEYYC